MTEAAQVEVINTALDALGKAQVTDLTEADLQQNAAARNLMAQLGPATRAVLTRHGWLCALSYGCIAEAQLPNDANWKYSHRYLLPAGALRVWEVRTPFFLRQIWDEIDPITFGEIGPPLRFGDEWEFATIDTDLGSQALVRSTICGTLAMSWTRICSYTAMPAPLRDAIALDAARRSAFNITGQAQMRAAMAAEAEKAVQLAISVDGTQQGGQVLAPSIPAMIRMISR